MTRRREGTFALAVAPVHRGFGFVVLDLEHALLDWGVKETRRDKHVVSRQRVVELIDLFHPHTLVLELTGGPSCRRRPRIRELIADLALLGEAMRVNVAFYDRETIHSCFALPAVTSKDELAHAVAREFPAIAHRVPKPRRAWEGAKHSMAIFEAASLAFAHANSTE